MQLDTEEKRQEFDRRIKRSASFQRLLNCPEGELFLAELKMRKRGFDPDPYQHAFNAGVQSVLDFIETVMTQDVESARKVLEEQKKKEAEK